MMRKLAYVRPTGRNCHSKGKAIDLTSPEQVLARPVGLMRWFQLEQFRALLKMEENPKGKTTRHWL